MDLERCRSGGWMTEVDPDPAAETIRAAEEPDVDNQHLLVVHVDGVKCSLQRRSGTVRVRTEDRDEAERVLRALGIGED